MAVESCVDGVEIFVWVVAVAFDGRMVVMDACCCCMLVDPQPRSMLTKRTLC